MFVENIPFFFVLRRKELIFIIVSPLFDELLFVIGIITQIHVYFHHVLEVFRYDGDPNVELVVDYDIEDLGSQYLALDQQHYIGFIQLQLFLYLTVDLILLLDVR